MILKIIVGSIIYGLLITTLAAYHDSRNGKDILLSDFFCLLFYACIPIFNIVLTLATISEYLKENNIVLIKGRNK